MFERKWTPKVALFFDRLSFYNNGKFLENFFGKLLLAYFMERKDVAVEFFFQANQEPVNLIGTAVIKYPRKSF